jgi:hypothetical protein
MSLRRDTGYENARSALSAVAASAAFRLRPYTMGARARIRKAVAAASALKVGFARMKGAHIELRPTKHVWSGFPRPAVLAPQNVSNSPYFVLPTWLISMG